MLLSQLVLLAFIWTELSPSRVMDRHPVLVLGSLGCFFSKTVTQVPSGGGGRPPRRRGRAACTRAAARGGLVCSFSPPSVPNSAPVNSPA